MINKRKHLAPALILLLTGCTDSMESITRELRNANNEAIDAMMMVTSEEQAYRMNTRVLRPIRLRYSNIEYKLTAWEANRSSNKEIVEETYASTGFYLYLAELEVNNMRYNFERGRLKNLYNQYQKRKLDQMIAAGEANPVIADPKAVCPELHELIETENVLKTLDTQLTQPKLLQLVARFPTMKGVDEFEERERKFKEKFKLFDPKGKITLRMKPA